MPTDLQPDPQSNPLAGITLPNDDERPIAPELTNLTSQQKQAGQHLKMFHDHFRSNLQILQSMIEKAENGNLDSSTLAAETDKLELIQNFRQFGSACGQHCQMINGHHSIEDQYIFPVLSSKAKAFQKVINRLKDEHLVVHALLERLVVKLNTLITDPNPQSFSEAKTVHRALEKLLISHFRYEEESIGDALGYFNVQV